MLRRDLLKNGAISGAAWFMESLASKVSQTMPIIDSHIHLFDTDRPGGVPWPERDDTVLYHPALPDRYAKIARPLGIRGAIVVEASPLKRDNDWLLNVAASNTFIVGIVGNLVPGTATFRADLDRLRPNPLFVGIRYGNLWGRDILSDSRNSKCLADLGVLAKYGLELDTANPDLNLMRAVVGIADRIPDLRIVLDHLPNASVPTDSVARTEYWSCLERLSENRNIFVKLSEVPVLHDGKLVTNSQFYKDRLDAIWNIFKDDNVLFGSDWPNSDTVTTYQETFSIIHEYMAHKSEQARNKFFWSNSIKAYRWRPRVQDQPTL